MIDRSRSFGAVAAAYDRHRPGYPTAALDWALSPAPGRAVLDLGAGTGKLSEAVLAVPGTTVTAVDPDPAMLAQLRERLPAVEARLGTAEGIPLPDASVDAAVVGQAWHWFEHDRAAAELARVVRPGGVVAIVRNDDDPSVEWVPGYQETLAAAGRPASASADQDAHPEHPALTAPELRRFPNPVPTTTDGFVDMIATHSWALVIDPAERAAVLDRLRAYLAERPETSSGAFVLPLVTTVVRTLRK